MTTTTLATTAPATGTLKLDKATSWSDVFKAIREAERQSATLVAVEAPVGKPLVLTDTETKALAVFAKQVGSLTVPGTRRSMTTAELTNATSFLATSKVVAKVAKRALEDTLRPAFMTHFDLAAERAGKVTEETRRDKDGYYVLADTESAKVEGEKHYAARSASEGSVSISEAKLKALVEAGKLTHAQYLAVTKPVRVIDEDAVLKAAQKNPELVAVFAEASTLSTPSVSLTIK